MSKKHPNQQPTVTTWEPQEISDLDIAFSTNVNHLMPAYRDIPDDFKSSSNPYVRLVAKWFFGGLKGDEFRAKSGVDKGKAIRHLKAILNSFEPAHEHKEAGVAYLMSLWFDLV